MTTITIPNRFTPREYQKPIMEYFDRGGKRAAWVVHRRGGKDLTALHQCCKEMHRRKAAYWHLFPSSEQGRKAIWEGFTRDGQRTLEQVFPREIRKSPAEFLPKAEMIVELKCGSIYRLVGADRIENVGSGPAGLILSEYALMRPSAWNLLRPMLRENDGWAMFVYTPRGNNHGKKLYDMALKNPHWFCDLKTLKDTQAFDYETTRREELAEGMPEPLFRQEYECDWTAALVGSIWGDLMEGIEKRGDMQVFEHPTDDVFTTWDLGIGDATAIWFWRVANDRVEMVDYYENQGKALSHYFEHVEGRPYKYVKHWLPHDARARTLQTGVSVLDQFWERWEVGKVEIGPALSVFDGLQATRRMLQRPIRFHPRCEDGIEALKQYHYKYNEDKKTFSNVPEHDWTSHAADAFRGVACVVKQIEGIMRSPPPIQKPSQYAKAVSESFTLDQLWEEHDHGRV
jgi:phage terminase large subunit